MKSPVTSSEMVALAPAATHCVSAVTSVCETTSVNVLHAASLVAAPAATEVERRGRRVGGRGDDVEAVVCSLIGKGRASPVVGGGHRGEGRVGIQIRVV